VELSSFTASYVNEFVTICWQTASETDVNGFNIYRNTEDVFGEADKINIDLIDGHGTTTNMNNYSFTDETADPYYTTYYYWLEVVNLGGTSDVYGSIIYEPGDIDNNGEINFVSTQFDNCYPNPATLGNTIHFGFRVGGIELTNRHVELKVYSVLGELVKEIVNEERLVDDYTEQWTPKNLPNGVYFYQLKTDNFNEVKKMVLVK
ncbi:MAG: T9SS type A sorting domain-containing protein, partial [Candidatus Cloacimonetes bacterium]|nr:T9SS type A sorting domain-containing protein [Candidatus Cloacimonadota bacterium]